MLLSNVIGKSITINPDKQGFRINKKYGLPRNMDYQEIWITKESGITKESEFT